MDCGTLTESVQEDIRACQVGFDIKWTYGVRETFKHEMEQIKLSNQPPKSFSFHIQVDRQTEFIPDFQALLEHCLRKFYVPETNKNDPEDLSYPSLVD